MSRVSLVMVVAGILLAGCASGKLAPEAAQLDAKKYEVPAGKSSIYIYRVDQGPWGAAVLQEVYLDGELIAFVGPRNFVRLDVEHGKHTILSRGGAAPSLTAKTVIDARINQNYFIRMWTALSSTILTTTIKHKIVSEEEGVDDLKGSRMVETF